jgi:hypothetical protein
VWGEGSSTAAPSGNEGWLLSAPFLIWTPALQQIPVKPKWFVVRRVRKIACEALPLWHSATAILRTPSAFRIGDVTVPRRSAPRLSASVDRVRKIAPAPCQSGSASQAILRTLRTIEE